MEANQTDCNKQSARLPSREYPFRIPTGYPNQGIP